MRKIGFIALLLFASPAWASTWTHTYCVTINPDGCTGDTLYTGSKDYSDADDTKAQQLCARASSDSQISCSPTASGYTCSHISFDGVAVPDISAAAYIHMHTDCVKESVGAAP
jgi:hypothetical protein